jgi:hypothetical protein
MIGIFQALVALFIFALIITPIILLSILLIRTSRPKTNPQSAKRLDELAEIDAAIIEETNAALATVLEKIQDIEERLDREDSTVKGFGNKK